MALSKPDFIREFRLGLVVYGGVSLAVYMNGVCREFYNAVRGRGVYKLIKALTDSDIVVDIISGTSAGGINGVLLSYALTNSSEKETYDFANLSGVWRHSGDINELLRKVNPSGDVNSILDGEGYYQHELARAFQSVWEKRSPAPVDDWFSDFSELDLFVTGTDVLGKISRQFDNTGKLIEVNDHHAVFILKHRKGRKTPFQPNDNEIPQKALAKLCRITSCFPVAFPVVTVKLEDDSSNPDREVDKQLVEWGDLDNRVKPNGRPENGYQLHFVDGGVLDNRPFSYTIREIYSRHFHRPVNRKLFYIDPSPDKFLDSPAFNKMAKPNIWESAMDSLVGLPSYDSIAVDLQEIANKNERVRRYKFLRSTVVSSAVKILGEKYGRGELEIKNGKLCSSSEQQKALTSPISVDKQDTPGEISDEQIYLRCRLIGLRDRVLPIISGLSQAKVTTSNTDKKIILQTAADLLSYIRDPEKQRAREEFLHIKGYEVRELDVEYSIRKHFFILNEIVQAIELEKYWKSHKQLESLARYLNRMLSLLEAIKFAIDAMFMIDQVQDHFAKLVQEAGKINMLKEVEEVDKKHKSKKTEEMREELYNYLFHLHRFLLDADQLLDESSLDNLRENQPYPKYERQNFFQVLSDNLPKTLKDDDSEESHDKSHNWLPSKSVDSVLHQLKTRAEKLGNLDQLDKTESTLSTMIDQDKYRFGDNRYQSILSKVDEISFQLIELFKTSLPSNDEKILFAELSLKFSGFDLIDQQVYPYEYLSDTQSQGLLEITRISPEDSQKGFGKGKKLEERLAGLQLRAFGGFFKKSWRSNDILWGRLDGLNRLVECLLTPTTIQSFRRFTKRNKHIDLSDLVEEAVPNATEDEKKLILDNLTKLSIGDKLSEEEFQRLLECIVLVGQRDILTTDLENVLKDTIEEQFSWNQKLGIPDSADLYDIGYRSNNDRNSSPNGQLQGLQKVDLLLDRLLEPKSKLRKSPSNVVGEPPVQALDGCQKYIEEEFKQKGKDGVKQDLRERFKNAFPNSGEDTREDLSNRLYWLLDQLSNQQIKRFSDTSKAFSIKYILALTPPLEILLKTSEEELTALRTTAPSETTKGIKAFNIQLNIVIEQIKKAESNLKPIFSPTDGYLDKPLIPFITGSLVDSSIQAILNDPLKMESYFRYQYRVGSEKVKINIPPIIRYKLLARSGLVIRDILRSEPTGEILSKSPIFILVDRLLRTFYFWVEAKDPATSPVPKILRPLLTWILVFVLAFGTASLVSQIPRFLLGVIITFLIAQLVFSTIGKEGSTKRGLKAISFLLVLMILASPLVGLPLPHKGTIRIKRLFNDHCPLIQTPLTVKDCISNYDNQEPLSIP
jgi:patatin-related protein